MPKEQSIALYRKDEINAQSSATPLIPKDLRGAAAANIIVKSEVGVSYLEQARAETYAERDAKIGKIPARNKKRLHRQNLLGKTHGIAYEHINNYSYRTEKYTLQMGALSKLSTLPERTLLSYFMSVIDTTLAAPTNKDQQYTDLVLYQPYSNLPSLPVDCLNAWDLVKRYLFLTPEKLQNFENDVLWDAHLEAALLDITMRSALLSMLDSEYRLNNLLSDLDRLLKPYENIHNLNKNVSQALKAALGLTVLVGAATVTISLPLLFLASQVATAIFILAAVSVTAAIIASAATLSLYEKTAKKKANKTEKEELSNLDTTLETLSKKIPEQPCQPNSQDEEDVYKEKFAKCLFFQGVEGVKKIRDRHPAYQQHQQCRT